MLFLAPILFATQSLPAIQKEIDKQYLKWDKAVVAHDAKTMESMLADDFSAKVKGREKPMTKKDFAGTIEARWKTGFPKELSFTTKIDKVESVKSDKSKDALYAASILETVEFEFKDGTKKKISFKSYDTWRKIGAHWQIVISANLD